MLASYRGNGSDFSSLLVCLVVAFFLCFYCGYALATQGQPSAQAILHHFYRAAGGNAWQHYEECDSEGTATAGKSGTLRYVENLHTGANVSQIEIPALDVRQADGDGPMQSWHQDANGDIQLFKSDSPDNIDDRYLASRAYWRPEFGARLLPCLPRKPKDPQPGIASASKSPAEAVSLSGSIAKPASSIAWKARPLKS